MSKDYYNLIKSWHIKASQEDYFSKFTFEYLAFIAFIRTQKYTEDEVRAKMNKPISYKVTDRDFIQTLKQDSIYKNDWVALLARDSVINDTVDSFFHYLIGQPLVVDDRWWNNDTYSPIQNIQASGAWRSSNDYVNIIETWYKIRNNLFHGTKSPEVERDQDLVRFSYLTLSAFVERVMIDNFEKHRLYPFYGHEFMERFFEGNAEVTTKPEGDGSWATIHELSMMDDRHFPVLIENQTFSRDDLISIIKQKLRLAYGTEQFDQLKNKLESHAGNDHRKKEILRLITMGL